MSLKFSYLMGISDSVKEICCPGTREESASAPSIIASGGHEQRGDALGSLLTSCFLGEAAPEAGHAAEGAQRPRAAEAGIYKMQRGKRLLEEGPQASPRA